MGESESLGIGREQYRFANEEIFMGTPSPGAGSAGLAAAAMAADQRP